MTPKEKAEGLHKSVTAFMITCVGADGYPLTKAVVPGKHRDSLDALYFCTNTSSVFAAEISNNSKANVYFFTQAEKWEGCLLKGNMEIATDLCVKEKYWMDEYKDAYPEKSFTDPDFCLLKFTPKSGRLYSDFEIEDFEME